MTKFGASRALLQEAQDGILLALAVTILQPDEETTRMIHPHLYIDGKWVRPMAQGTLEVENPSTEESIGRVPAADARDVDQAVVAAARAFERWASTPVAARARFLQALLPCEDAR